MRDFHAAGRSPAFATNAMAATSMPEATLTAIEVMKAGGNALDAAIAAAAVLAVVEPHSTGVGGDLFCLYAPAGSDKVIALNGSGRTPAGLSLEALAGQGLSAYGAASAHAVTVPGGVSAWEKLAKTYGRKGLNELLRPAIRFAEDGYVVTPRVAADWAEVEAKLKQNGADIFLPGGRAPQPGTRLRNPQLAATLRAIAKDGARAFYTGPIAAEIVKDLRARGGFHTEADFAAGLDVAEFVTPISHAFAGHEVWECPPNGSGIIALMLMGIMDGFSPGTDPLDPLRLHRHVEAARLVYRDRDAFLADPTQVDVPVEHLLSDNYIAGLRGLIQDDRALETLPAAGHLHKDTVYIAVVDADGNCCSFINSIFQSFGSGIVAGNTGVVMHNRGFSFSTKPGHPNQVAPNKRPMHTIIPAMAFQHGKPQIVFGVMGGQYQPMGQSWVLANVLQYGLDPQAALDLPRLFPFAGKVEVERGIPASIRTALAAKGHKLEDIALPHGGGQMIQLDHQRGVLIGGSDPRKDGCALGY
ncbi:gamma-glutamyltransferase family protein [Acidocella aminolytica]|uniref:Gamma-glutamyltranspeptidase n=1 Tax=Acidocella aminolytica 101 = DSM 11237 TaxID=1120923 RepID=A0A0D6PBU9_9PROT|nr:gamma-glutamyltransferase family protein [Acidocella aminolytica]GAN79127.1 gamma-glutamyltranspeptidase [Acidocella aminolytica 101 = DSM 11237]GBQ43740.1 gamma-glutamyltransferase [Acidocella aminolytica 101 = DSM 11237]SHE65772.1 gamma-glutamyltransferase 2. Threonine peptidase. MEROPS family T03 [Acidocella aminolytica 101 = DSM 11237]